MKKKDVGRVRDNHHYSIELIPWSNGDGVIKICINFERCLWLPILYNSRQMKANIFGVSEELVH